MDHIIRKLVAKLGIPPSGHQIIIKNEPPKQVIAIAVRPQYGVTLPQQFMGYEVRLVPWTR